MFRIIEKMTQNFVLQNVKEFGCQKILLERKIQHGVGF